MLTFIPKLATTSSSIVGATVRVKVGQRIERKITEYTEEDRI